MPAYVVAHICVEDPAAYEVYQKSGLPTVLAAGGRVIAGGEGGVSLEGQELPNGSAIVEFETIEAALAWYHSEQYQQTIPMRAGASTAHMIAVIPGLNPPAS